MVVFLSVCQQKNSRGRERRRVVSQATLTDYCSAAANVLLEGEQETHPFGLSTYVSRQEH